MGNKVVHRRNLWNNLRMHNGFISSKPWIVLGDFNVALNIEDSSTGISSMSRGMCDFKDCVEEISVADIHRVGLHYTWNQRPNATNGILKKMDRAMGNVEFMSMFPTVYADFLPYGMSDHSSCLVKFPGYNSGKGKFFKFSNFAIKKPEFNNIVKEGWLNSK